MAELAPTPPHTAVPLTRALAEDYATELASLASLIPLVEYTAEDVVSEQKGERMLSNKWLHSLIIIEDSKPIAFVMAYERQSEENAQYPDNTLYISELAVAETHWHQGIAQSLLQQFFERNNELGFRTLSGAFNYSIQTNSADWNKHVISLYESFGFKQRAIKPYPNRTDVVLGVGVDGLKLR